MSSSDQRKGAEDRSHAGGVGWYGVRQYGRHYERLSSDEGECRGDIGCVAGSVWADDFFPGPSLQVAQVWLGVPEAAGGGTATATATQSVGAFSQNVDAQAWVTGTSSRTVGAFTQNADASAWVTATASQSVGAFTQNADGSVWVSATASQNVGAFTQTATGDVSGGTDLQVAQVWFGLPEAAPVVETAPVRKTGGGVTRGTRFVVRIDDEEFVVSTAAEARALIAQAEQLAEQAAQAKAAELAARERVRMRAARRAAPVVRIESPEPVAEVEAIRDQVDEVNARIQQMYVEALRTALIAREIQRRLDEDEEEALAALLL